MMRTTAMLLSIAALTGCGDPIVGVWQAEAPSSCGVGEDTADFVVDSDLRGEGEVCGCEYSFQLEHQGDDVYEADIDFDAGCLIADGHYECTLSVNGEELDCGTLGEYERVE